MKGERLRNPRAESLNIPLVHLFTFSCIFSSCAKNKKEMGKTFLRTNFSYFQSHKKKRKERRKKAKEGKSKKRAVSSPPQRRQKEKGTTDQGGDK